MELQPHVETIMKKKINLAFSDLHTGNLPSSTQ